MACNKGQIYILNNKKEIQELRDAVPFRTTGSRTYMFCYTDEILNLTFEQIIHLTTQMTMSESNHEAE